MDLSAKTKIVSKLGVATEVDGYTIISEPSVAKGGSLDHPTPVRLFIASLLNCTLMTVKSFCSAREIPTEGLELDFKGELEEEIYKDMEIIMTLPKGFPEKYRNSISDIAATCTVKKLIKNLPEIRFSVKS